MAATLGLKGISQHLIDHKAPINEKDLEGMTPLFKVALDPEARVARLLLEAGVDVNLQRTADRSTVLHVAVRGDNKKLIQILLGEPKLDLNILDGKDQTAYQLGRLQNALMLYGHASHLAKVFPTNQATHLSLIGGFNSASPISAMALWDDDLVMGCSNGKVLKLDPFSGDFIELLHAKSLIKSLAYDKFNRVLFIGTNAGKIHRYGQRPYGPFRADTQAFLIQLIDHIPWLRGQKQAHLKSGIIDPPKQKKKIWEVRSQLLAVLRGRLSLGAKMAKS